MKKLKDLLNESVEMGRVYSNPYATAFVKENEETPKGKMEMTDEQKQAFYEAVKQYRKYGESVYRNAGLQEVYESIKNMVEMAGKVTLSETGDWFDGVTVNRHMKRMGESFKVFERTLKEVSTLQQRLEASYDEIGEVLGKYYEITELEEEVDEGNEFGAARAKAIAAGNDSFEVDGKTYPVKDVDKDDKENAKKFTKESMKLTDMIKKPSVNEAKYDIGMARKGNGITVYNKAEEEKGDYKNIAFIDNKGNVKLLDKKLPKDVLSKIDDEANKMKESINENAYAVIEKNIWRAIQLSKYADGNDYLQKMLFGRVIDSLRGNKHIVTKISNIKTKLGKGYGDITITAKVDVVLPDSAQTGTKNFKYTQSNSKVKGIIESINEAKKVTRIKGFNKESDGYILMLDLLKNDSKFKNIVSNVAIDLYSGGKRANAFKVLVDKLTKVLTPDIVGDVVIKLGLELADSDDIRAGKYNRNFAGILSLGLLDSLLETPLDTELIKDLKNSKLTKLANEFSANRGRKKLTTYMGRNESINEGNKMIKLKKLLKESIGIGELPSSKLMKMKIPAKDMLNPVNEGKNFKAAKQALIDFNNGKLSEDDMVKTVIKSLGFKFDKYSEEEAGITLSKDIKQGKIPTDDYILNNVIDVLTESVNEARFKKVTKQMWAKMDYDERVNALLTFFKDPNDAEEYGDSEWSELPSGVEGSMIIFESKRTKGSYINEEYTYNEFVKDNLGKKYVESEEKGIKLALKLLGVKSGDDIRELTNTMDSTNTALYLDNAKENGELTKLPIKSKYFEKAYLGKWKNGQPMLAFSDGFDYFVYVKK